MEIQSKSARRRVERQRVRRDVLFVVVFRSSLPLLLLSRSLALSKHYTQPSDLVFPSLASLPSRSLAPSLRTETEIEWRCADDCVAVRHLPHSLPRPLSLSLSISVLARTLAQCSAGGTWGRTSGMAAIGRRRPGTASAQSGAFASPAASMARRPLRWPSPSSSSRAALYTSGSGEAVKEMGDCKGQREGKNRRHPQPSVLTSFPTSLSFSSSSPSLAAGSPPTCLHHTPTGDPSARRTAEGPLRFEAASSARDPPAPAPTPTAATAETSPLPNGVRGAKVEGKRSGGGRERRAGTDRAAASATADHGWPTRARGLAQCPWPQPRAAGPCWPTSLGRGLRAPPPRLAARRRARTHTQRLKPTRPPGSCLCTLAPVSVAPGLDSGGSSSTESTRAAMRDYAQHASDLDLSASEMLESVSELMRIVDVGGAESPFEATDAAAGKGSASPSALQLTARSSRRAASQAVRTNATSRCGRRPLHRLQPFPGRPHFALSPFLSRCRVTGRGQGQGEAGFGAKFGPHLPTLPIPALTLSPLSCCRSRRAPLPMKVFLPGGVEGDPVTAATALDADDDNAMDTADGAADAAAASDVAAATSFSKLAAMAGRRPAGRQSAVSVSRGRCTAALVIGYECSARASARPPLAICVPWRRIFKAFCAVSMTTVKVRARACR